MVRKLAFLLIILLLPALFYHCHKNSDTMTGFAAEDTTDNGGAILKKPNIYIYPAETTTLNVQMNFPKGGKVIASIPKYSEGWNVRVDPSGLIDGQYHYLFYEARIPDALQKTSGWIVKGDELESFFKGNLKALLFSKREIADFIEYWIPLLDPEKTYVIYPHYSEELAGVVNILFSIPPENFIRVLYAIEEFDGKTTVETPRLPEVDRSGYAVMEWGVVYK